LTGYRRSPWLNIGVIAVAIVALPYDSFRADHHERVACMKGFTLFLIAAVWAVSATAADRRVANVPADLAVFESFGSHRLLAFQVCSPEHCWHDVFVQALTNDFPGKVLCTAPIVEFNGSSDVIVKSARQSENDAAVLNLQLISSHDAFEPYSAKLTMQKGCGYRLDPNPSKGAG